MAKSAAVASNLVIPLQHQHRRRVPPPILSVGLNRNIITSLRTALTHTFADRAQTKHSNPPPAWDHPSLRKAPPVRPSPAEV